MRLVKPSYAILTRVDMTRIYKAIERAGRTCYKSEARITETSAEEFIRKVISRGHESVIEHESLSVRFVIDRGVSHELVRHRLCAFSQESTRYCNYSGGTTFVIPPWVEVEPGEYTEELYRRKQLLYADSQWFTAMLSAEAWYKDLRGAGWTPQQARSVLPNSLKTEIVVTANLREWRHILRLRTSRAAHPQIREVMEPLLAELRRRLPAVFEARAEPKENTDA